MLNKVFSRIDPILDIISSLKKEKGKISCLSIGMVGNGINDTFETADGKIISYGKDWHHGRVAEIVDDLVGVDIAREKMDVLKKLGYNVIVQSADEPFQITTENKLYSIPALLPDSMQKKFDAVLCEEVAEHLQNLRTFFDNVKRHLKEDGTFIITTPNPWGWSYLLQFIFLGHEFSNDYHTAWFSKKIMYHLLKENDFEVVDYKIIDAVSENTRGRILQNLLRFLPKRFGINQIFVCKLRGT